MFLTPRNIKIKKVGQRSSSFLGGPGQMLMLFFVAFEKEKKMGITPNVITYEVLRRLHKKEDIFKE